MTEEEKRIAEAARALDSKDPMERRQGAEALLSERIDDATAKKLTAALGDEDTGVRDAASMTLIYNENPNISEFVVPKISSDDIAVRNLAGDILVKRGSGSVAALVGYVDKGDDDDRKFVIDVLALIGDASAKDEVRRILAETNDDNVALACVEALGAMRVEEAVPALIEAFDKNELFGPTVVDSLGKIGSPKALPLILDRFDHADTLTQYSMLESLGELGDEETVPFLIEKLKQYQPPLTWPVIYSLNKLKDRFNVDTPSDERLKKAVLAAFDEAEPKYKKAATALMLHFPGDDAIDACLNNYGFDAEIDSNIAVIFTNQPEGFFRRVTRFVSDEQKNLKALLDAMKDMIGFDNGKTLRELDDVTLHALCEKLSGCFDHPNEEVRRSAMELLFYVNPDTAFFFIDTLAADKNIWNKLRLVDILERIDSEQSNEALKLLMEDEDAMLRQKAGAVLEQRGATDAEL
jgi:HEAT repeat protein